MKTNDDLEIVDRWNSEYDETYLDMFHWKINKSSFL